MLKFNVYDLSNYIIGFCKKNNINDCTNKKLLKLIYYVYSWMLVLFKKKVINDCFFEAWIHGPVISPIYNKYKTYQYNSIDYNEEYEKERDKRIDKETKKEIDTILTIYSKLSADELETKTHQEEPWLKARLREDKNILDKDIIKYYKKLWNKNNINLKV